MRRSFLAAVCTIIGTIIGAGVYALPSLFARMGIWQASLCFWSLALLVAVTYALYVDVIVSESSIHRLPGYVRLMLGKRWGELATFTHFFNIYGAHIIYLLLAGAFFQSLLSAFGITVPTRLGLVLMFLAIATTVWAGFRKAARIETVVTGIMLLLFVAVIVRSFFQGAPPTVFIAQPSWAAFGLILFALTGLPAIAEAVELSGRKQKTARAAVLIGTLSAALIIWLFAIAMARIGGTAITRNPQSLAVALTGWGPFVIPLVGLFSVGIAYLCTAEDLHASWLRDYKLPFRSAWALTLVPAFFISILMGDGFILMATVLGTICGGMNGVFVGMMRTALAEQHRQASMVALALLIVFIYAFGMSGQIASWLFL